MLGNLALPGEPIPAKFRAYRFAYLRVIMTRHMYSYHSAAHAGESKRFQRRRRDRLEKMRQDVVRGCYFLVFVQLFEKYGTFIERNTALIEKVSPCSALAASSCSVSWRRRRGGYLPAPTQSR
eukprot:SAG31_NODE_4873_length_2893_cov_8.076951_2_plen_123_part_00